MYEWDVNGKEYIDSCSGAVNVSLGYGREDMAEVIRKQTVELSYLTRFTSVPPILDECSDILADFTGMDRFFIAAMAKCMSGGYFPVGAVAVSKKISDVFKEIGHYYAGFTWAGNPVACAVVIENTKIMQRENLLENVNIQGEYLKEELIKMRDRHPIIGDVRGRGLLIGVEFVKDHATHTSLPNEEMALAKVMQAGYANGVILEAASGKMNKGLEGEAILLAPYYSITKEEVDILLDRLDKIFGDAEKQIHF